MNSDLNSYLNADSFFLSSVIIITVILCVITEVFFSYKNTKKSVKYALTYLLSVTMVYELSTLLAFYSTPDYFRIMIYIKIGAAFLLKTALLFFTSIYIENKKLIRIFALMQILSVATVIPATVFPSYMDSIVTFSSPLSARYAGGAEVYAVISSIIFIASGFVFYFTSPLFRKKKKHIAFLMLFTALNLAILTFSVFGSKDIVHEKTHILILMVLLATVFKMSPFYDRKDSLLSVVNIINSKDEELIILDRNDNTSYINNCIKGLEISNCTEEIKAMIKAQGNLPDLRGSRESTGGNTIIEGDIDFHTDKIHYLHYSITPFFNRKKFIGRIIVLRDITPIKELLEVLNEKNDLLNKAYEAQRENLRVTGKLAIEKERSRILNMVNSIAGGYLITIRSRVAILEQLNEEDAHFKDFVERENSVLLEITRDTTEKVRTAVRQMYNKQGRGEAG
ncbi:MAG: hypothetical protein PHV32_15445 [Eubacteriales bacterium]|nr:hypothetical protein [Eubacteriales bacterium]